MVAQLRTTHALLILHMRRICCGTWLVSLYNVQPHRGMLSVCWCTLCLGMVSVCWGTLCQGMMSFCWSTLFLGMVNVCWDALCLETLDLFRARGTSSVKSSGFIWRMASPVTWSMSLSLVLWCVLCVKWIEGEAQSYYGQLRENKCAEKKNPKLKDRFERHNYFHHRAQDNII